MPGTGFSITLRTATSDDRDALSALWLSCDLLRPWNDPLEDIARASACATSQVIVALRGTDLVGSVMAGYDGHRGWLYYLAVSPDCRRHGIGRALVRHAEDWLADQGALKVQLMIRPEGHDTLPFYADAGYGPNPCAIYHRWLKDQPSSQATGGVEVTITHLEMTEAPKISVRHPPPGQAVALLRAVSPTLSFYRYLYHQVGDPWQWYDRRALSDEALSAIIHDELVEIYVLYADGTPAGFAELDRRPAPTIDLAFFGLIPDFIGRGLGPFLLGSAIDIAWSHGPERLTVNTCTLDHASALPVYQRMGFKPYRRETKIYRDPRFPILDEE
ncbi:MAG: GNAT family acetyltransferase [Pseudomonadota bacterium]